MKTKGNTLSLFDNWHETPTRKASTSDLVWVYELILDWIRPYNLVKETEHMVFAKGEYGVSRYDKRRYPCFFTEKEALEFARSKAEDDMNKSRRAFEKSAKRVLNVNALLGELESGQLTSNVNENDGQWPYGWCR